MSNSNRSSKESSKDQPSFPDRPLDNDCQLTHDTAESRDLCRCGDPPPFLSIYNVRFPANICEHKAPYFSWQPTAPPGRGGGSIVVPTEKTSPSPKLRKSPSPRKLSDVSSKAPREATSSVVQEVPKSPVKQEVAREPKMSASEVKILKRETKNR